MSRAPLLPSEALRLLDAAPRSWSAPKDRPLGLVQIDHTLGLRVPPLLRRRWSDAVRALVEGHPSLPAIFEPLLRVGDPWSPGVAARASPTHDPATLLHREMAGLQGAMLAEATRGQGQELHPQARRAAIAEDLAWAFTRPDRTYADRIAYEALASELLDSPWRMARRRRPGPADFVALGLDERHIMLATATILTGPPGLRLVFYRPTGGWEEDLAFLDRRLRDSDRAEFRDRWRRWRDLA